MSDSILHKIGERTRKRVEEEKGNLPLSLMSDQMEKTPVPSPFLGEFEKDAINVIAEVKFASPSEGVITETHDPAGVAKGYLDNGAKAISVLTEPEFFRGRLSYLVQVRRNLPQSKIIMKDFFVDEYQIFQARLSGANAILLIVALLSCYELRELYRRAIELSLTPLIEVHNEEELDAAMELNPNLVGINNRNLKNMTVSLDTSEKLIQRIPSDVVTISESGIYSRSDIERLRECGFSGFLVGTSLMRSPDPGQALGELLGRRPLGEC